jgi:hypothetical protein
MSLFRKTFFTAVLLLLTVIVSGGDLDRFSKELDFIEYSFVYAATQPYDSENRTEVEKRIKQFYFDLLTFRKKIRKLPNVPNFLEPAGKLTSIFRELGDSLTTVRLPRNRGTALGNYSRTYNEYLRDINNLAGKKGSPRKNTPTLKTLPLRNYKAWLDRVTQDYIQSLRRLSKSNQNTSRNRNRNKNRNRNRNYLSMQTLSQLEEYAQSIAKLRLCFALLAQNKFYKE